MKKTALPFMALVLALLLAGCRGHKEMTRPEAPLGDVPQVSTLRIPFTATVEGVTVSGQLRWQRDSVVWVSASKLIELGRARITRDSLIAYIPPYNQCLRLPMQEVRRQFGVDFDSVQRAVLLAPRPLTLSHPRLSAPVQVRFAQPTANLPLSFPLSIPPSAKPLNL